MLTREELAERILALPPHLQGHAAELALQVYGPLTTTETERADAFPELSLYEFIQEGWHVVEPRRRFVPGWQIEAVCEHLEAITRRDIQQLIINIPPGHTKSLLTTVFWPAWEWTALPELRYLCATYALNLSKRDSLRCRRLIGSTWYQSHWGETFRLSSDQNEKLRFENTRTGYRIATSVGGTGTGERADRIIVDDPHKAAEVYSEAKRGAVLEWWDEEMSTRGTDQWAAFVVIMQRLHAQDLTGHLLAQGGWEHLMLPMRFEPSRKCVTSIGFEDPRTENGELLSPERFPEEQVTLLERKLMSAAAGQLQQRPAPAEGNIFKKAWWRFWRPLHSDLPEVEVHIDGVGYVTAETVELPRRLDEQIQSWDLTFDSSSSAVVGQVWGRKAGDFFLLDEVRDFWQFTGQLAAIRELTRRWPEARAKLVEHKANAAAMIDTLQHEIPGIIPWPTEGDKELRARAVSPLVEAGNVYLPHPTLAPWVWAYIEELTDHPNGEFDDRGDVTAQALRRLSSAAQVGQPEQWATAGRS